MTAIAQKIEVEEVPASAAKFNYEGLPAKTAGEARAAAERIRLRIQRSAEDIIEIGRDLIAQKEILGHGHFLPWLKAEFNMTARQAQIFMNVAERLGPNAKSVSHLPATALYLLAAPSTPQAVVEEVTAKAQVGETPSKREIQEMIKAARSAEERVERAQGKADKADERARREADKRAGAERQREDFFETAQRLGNENLLLKRRIEELVAGKTVSEPIREPAGQGNSNPAGNPAAEAVEVLPPQEELPKRGRKDADNHADREQFKQRFRDVAEDLANDCLNLDPNGSELARAIDYKLATFFMIQNTLVYPWTNDRLVNVKLPDNLMQDGLKSAIEEIKRAEQGMCAFRERLESL